METRTPNEGDNTYGEGVRRFTIQMPDELRERIDAALKRDGISLAAWLSLAAEQRLAGAMRADVIQRLAAVESRVARLEERFGLRETHEDS